MMKYGMVQEEAKGDQGSHQTKLKVDFHESIISLGQGQWIYINENWVDSGQILKVEPITCSSTLEMGCERKSEFKYDSI